MEAARPLLYMHLNTIICLDYKTYSFKCIYPNIIMSCAMSTDKRLLIIGVLSLEAARPRLCMHLNTRYLIKLSNVFVKIMKCICPNIEMYLSKFWNIHFQIHKFICPLLTGERLLIIWVWRQQGPSYGCISTQLARSYVAANCKQHCNQSCKVFWWTLLPSTSYMLLLLFRKNPG